MQTLQPLLGNTAIHAVLTALCHLTPPAQPPPLLRGCRAAAGCRLLPRCTPGTVPWPLRGPAGCP